MKKINLKGLTRAELEEFVRTLGEPAYRGKQLFDWIYTKEVDQFPHMTDFSKSLRDKLSEGAEIPSLALVKKQESSADHTMKLLFELADGKKIESVLIPPRTAFRGTEAKTEDEQSRLTLCVSTQVGCPLDCAFCATASMGFLRNLIPGEIVDQVIQAKKLSGKKITNVVFMGMGEPLLNYDNVMKAVEIISTGLKIAARRITVSTAGWVPGIRQMADELRKVKLAVSLHSLDPAHRTSLIPLNRKYSLDQLLEAVEYYYRKTKTRVTFEYILFAGVNDTPADVRRLIQLTRRIPSKINIIPFHNIDFVKPKGVAAQLLPTSRHRIDEIVEELRTQQVTVFVRSSAGEDIDAACGQLAVTHRHPVRTGRSQTTQPLFARSS